VSNYNIILAGVGGQGLVLTTKIICETALKAGYDVKSNDVIGLSQRGGKIWGSVRIGENIHSPNIPNHGDIILGMELLEAYRWRENLIKGGIAIVNTEQIPPVPVITEKVPYPDNILIELEKDFSVTAFNATEMAESLGTIKVMNTILMGVLASKTDIPEEYWLEAVRENVPTKFIELNEEAFLKGYEYESKN